MNQYRERLEQSGQLQAFETARKSGDRGRMTQILQAANFTASEIESILWSKGDISSPPAPDEQEQTLWDKISGRVGAALISGVILGGVFVWGSAGFEAHRGHELKAMMKDYRSPSEAYYEPFLWGFALGFVGGLVTGSLVREPFSSKEDD